MSPRANHVPLLFYDLTFKYVHITRLNQLLYQTNAQVPPTLPGLYETKP